MSQNFLNNKFKKFLLSWKSLSLQAETKIYKNFKFR